MLLRIPEWISQVRERSSLSRDLRQALVHEEFEVYHQPQSRLTDNQTIGYEALIRWRHPTRGMISPADFIPIAEETALIVPIGEWVLRKACATAASWPEPYRIAVNLSPVQFTHGGLPETVHAILTETGLATKAARTRSDGVAPGLRPRLGASHAETAEDAGRLDRHG